MVVSLCVVHVQYIIIRDKCMTLVHKVVCFDTFKFPSDFVIKASNNPPEILGGERKDKKYTEK